MVAIDENRYITMGTRLYDPDLGQFLSVDPPADIFAFTSPYVYANHKNKADNSNLLTIGQKDSNKKSWIGRQISGLFNAVSDAVGDAFSWIGDLFSSEDEESGDYKVYFNGEEIGSIDVKEYSKIDKKDNNYGVHIILGFLVTKSGKFGSYRWIQTVWTSDPLGGYKSPYNDPCGSVIINTRYGFYNLFDDKPYYMDNSNYQALTDFMNFKLGTDYTSIFADGPQRNVDFNFWVGELTLVGVQDGINYPLITFNYGFASVFNVTTTFPLFQSFPTQFHKSTFNNFNPMDFYR